MSSELIIYIGDMGGNMLTSDVAEQLRKAYERNRHSEWTSECTGAIKFQENEIFKYRMATWESQTVPTVDVIQFLYHENLSGPCSFIPFVHIVEMTMGLLISSILMLVVGLPRAIGCCFCCGFKQCCRLRSVMQAIFVMQVYWLSLIYFAVLVWALYEVAAAINEKIAIEGKIALVIVIVLATLNFFIPEGWSDRWTSMYKGWIIVMRYLGLLPFPGAHSARRKVLGEFRSLIMRVQNDYTRIHVVGYSVGSVIALDALYPFSDERHLAPDPDKIGKLVTLGCPFNLIRMFLPRYYSGNRYLEDRQNIQWTNIFIPADAFGSNFSNACISTTDEGKCARANINIQGCDVDENDEWRNGVPRNQLHKKGSLGNSGVGWLDELLLVFACIIGYGAFAHFWYTTISPSWFRVIDDGIADLIVEACDEQGPRTDVESN